MTQPVSRSRRAQRGLVVGGVVLAVLLAAYGAAARLGPLRAPAGWPPPSDHAEYSAVLHVHSAYSHDGRGTIEEIAGAAARRGVRVVFMTDHSTLAPLRDGKEAWYGSTLVLIGAELSTNAGYYLLLDPRPDAPVEGRGLAFIEVLAAYRESDAIVLLAHPEHPRLGPAAEPPAPVDGIEIMNLFDQVVAAPWVRQLAGLVAYPANPEMAVLSVVHWPRRVFERWDRMARERPTIGVLSLDAHGGIQLTEETGVRFPSHETSFRLGQLHFVTEEPLSQDAADRLRVYRAMRAGRFYNAFDGFAPAAGFRFEAHRGGPAPAVALMGETLRVGDGWEFQVRVPPVGETRVRLVRDGQVVREASGREPLRAPAGEPGVYRVEVDLLVNLFPIATARHMPWIFSNPIYVRS